MTTEKRPTFTCKVCAKVLIPRFLPSTAPNCPSCGADTTPNQIAKESELTVFCPTCHTKGSLYESDACTNCGAEWGNWSGGVGVEQLQDSGLEGDRVLYRSSRGPEGGSIPRWYIV
ncbi:MAG: hypothetical protein O3B95_05405 [Chloroflexi bacterium]|nr:hypothetical protein [Chloroflexota bacterium]